jgi:hypothetical protein
MVGMRISAAVLLSLMLTGCVSRYLRITSEPPGAAVTIDGNSVGNTPVKVPFTWYGTREIILEKSGHESIVERKYISAPWWQTFPLDFITEVILPIPLEDVHELEYRLKPFQEDEAAVKQRAEALKKKAHED